MGVSLYILRHAEALPLGPGAAEHAGGDHARVLAPDGRRAARLVGRFLARLGEPPERVLVSSAARARETAELARDAGGWSAPNEPSDALYGATPEKVLDVLRSLEGRPSRVLVVAHQPTLGLLIRAFTGGEPELAPATLAHVELRAEGWRDVGPGGRGERAGRLAWLFDPTLLGARPRGT